MLSNSKGNQFITLSSSSKMLYHDGQEILIGDVKVAKKAWIEPVQQWEVSRPKVLFLNPDKQIGKHTCAQVFVVLFFSRANRRWKSALRTGANRKWKASSEPAKPMKSWPANRRSR
jgi:hypothetical protein